MFLYKRYVDTRNHQSENTTRCLDCGEHIYEQLYLGQIYVSLYYLLYNSASW
jgi:hypothetical protein